ncbi:MAG: formylmethanofuran dehydrogenase subunit C [Gammaproteobacteria bacterium]|jgi:formylmethanofuran dehydrogenase subunit C
MTGMIFTLKSPPELPVDLSPLIPEKLDGKTKTQIGEIQLLSGKEHIKVSKIFSTRGSDSSHIEFHRSSSKLTHIGQGMTKGSVSIHGDSGDFLGKNMCGGQIESFGNTGDWTASSMSGGLIEIHGNTGDYLGSNFSGEQQGMNEGTVIVSGNAGNRVGERMRRGMIVIRGQAGDYCANQMLAGSIIILGKTGAYLGYGMKRGTIVLIKKPKHIIATFHDCGLLKIEFLRLLFKQMAISNKQCSDFSKFGPEAIRYAGDISCSGKGEILILQNARLSK